MYSLKDLCDFRDVFINMATASVGGLNFKASLLFYEKANFEIESIRYFFFQKFSVREVED